MADQEGEVVLLEGLQGHDGGVARLGDAAPSDAVSGGNGRGAIRLLLEETGRNGGGLVVRRHQVVGHILDEDPLILCAIVLVYDLFR